MISLDGYNCLAVIMSFSTEEDAINAMLLEFGGEDVELVLDELRKCHQVEKVLRGKQCTERMHEIPKSYGKFSGLAVSQKIRVRKLWSLVPQETRINILLTAQKNANEISIGATASKVCNTHSDEMSRVGHLLSYPGAASLITKTRSSMGVTCYVFSKNASRVRW